MLIEQEFLILQDLVASPGSPHVLRGRAWERIRAQTNKLRNSLAEKEKLHERLSRNAQRQNIDAMNELKNAVHALRAQYRDLYYTNVSFLVEHMCLKGLVRLVSSSGTLKIYAITQHGFDTLSEHSEKPERKLELIAS